MWEKQFDKLPAIAQSLKILRDKAVYVGIPEDETDRLDGDMTNALLAWIHTEGSPVNNIPPRPFLKPAIEANRLAIAQLQEKALLTAQQGNPAATLSALERIGMFARDAVKRWWDDPRNNWPPNKPETIRRKGSSHPLVNSGQLKNAVNYVVK